MILDSKCGLRGVLVDVENGRRIPFAFWADTETGEWRAWKAAPGGNRVAHPKEEVRGRCRLRFVESYAPAPRTPSAVDGRAAAEEEAGIRRVARRTPLFAGVCCDVPGCHRLREWAVADERILEPLAGPGGRLQERGVVTAVHAYCSRHYRPPVSVSSRGVESLVDVMGARPQ